MPPHGHAWQCGPTLAAPVADSRPSPMHGATALVYVGSRSNSIGLSTERMPLGHRRPLRSWAHRGGTHAITEPQEGCAADERQEEAYEEACEGEVSPGQAHEPHIRRSGEGRGAHRSSGRATRLPCHGKTPEERDGARRRHATHRVCRTPSRATAQHCLHWLRMLALREDRRPRGCDVCPAQGSHQAKLRREGHPPQVRLHPTGAQGQDGLSRFLRHGPLLGRAQVLCGHHGVRLGRCGL